MQHSLNMEQQLCSSLMKGIQTFVALSRIFSSFKTRIEPSVTSKTKECKLCFWEKTFPDSDSRLLASFCRPFSAPSGLIIQLQWEDSLLLNKTMTSWRCARPCSASPVCLDLLLSPSQFLLTPTLPWTLHSHTHIWKHSCRLIVESMKYFWTSRPWYGQSF